MAFSNSNFGSKPQGSSLFGSSQTSTSATQTPSTFGGTSLFGGNASATAPGTGTQPHTNIFGGSSTGIQGTQHPQTNIFGGSTASAQQPQSGMFGTNTTSTQQPTTGMFGSTTAGSQQPQAGLFGSSTTSTQQPQTNIFGSSTTTSNPPGGGLFSSFPASTQQQQQQQPQPQPPNTTNPLQPQATLPAFNGGSLYGARTQQQQQPVPAAGTSIVLTKTTKFNDLAEDVRRELESLDSFIQSQIQISKDLHQRKLGEEPLKGYDLIKGVHKDFVDCYTTLRHDWHFMRDLKAKVDRAVEDTIVATRIVDGFRNPQAGGTTSAGYLKEHAGFPFEFFSRVTEHIAARLSWYKATIEQIERKLTSPSSQAQTPHSIAAALQAQHQTFLALASKTATSDAELQQIKALYTQLWRQKTGSMRDPFDELDKNAAMELDFEALPLNGK